MSEKQAKIVFTPSGKRGTFVHGTSVLDAARSLGVDVDSVCGGRAMCGRCQVVCAEGEFAKHAISSKAEHLSPVGEVETQFAERRRNFKADRRLSCQTKIVGDVVIDVPAESQMHRQVVRKNAEHRDITLDTGVHLFFVDVAEADMYEPSGDVQRLLRALESEWGLANLKCDWPVLPNLQAALRKGKWQVTVAVYKNEWVIAVWPGFKRDAFGVAIDIWLDNHRG